MNTDFYFKKTSYSKKKINLLFIFSITFFFPLLIFTKTPGYNPYSINELLIILTMIIWSLVLLYKKNIHKIQGAYVFLILIYFFFQAVLATASASYLAAFSSLLLHNKYIILSFLVFFFIDIKNEVFLIKSIVLVAVAAIWIGTLKIIENPSQMLSLYGVGGYSRNASVFPNPNMFGVYVLVTIFLELYLFDSIKNNKKKIVFIVFILLPSLLSLLMSFSRRAWGLFIIGSFFIFYLKKVTNYFLLQVYY